MFFESKKKVAISREPELQRPRFKVEHNAVVTLDYTLRDDDNPDEILDSTNGRGLFTYIHGRGQLPAGMEHALEGRVPGDKVTVSVPAVEAFGARDESAKQILERPLFLDTDHFEVGMEFEMPTEEGLRYARVIDVDDNVVTVDLNHPLAGKNLHFTALVVSVRPASEDEIKSGRVQL